MRSKWKKLLLLYPFLGDSFKMATGQRR